MRVRVAELQQGSWLSTSEGVDALCIVSDDCDPGVLPRRVDQVDELRLREHSALVRTLASASRIRCADPEQRQELLSVSK